MRLTIGTGPFSQQPVANPDFKPATQVGYVERFPGWFAVNVASETSGGHFSTRQLTTRRERP